MHLQLTTFYSFLCIICSLISWPRLYLPLSDLTAGGARQSLPRILALWTGRTAFIPTRFRSQSKTVRLYLRIYQQCSTNCRRPLRVGTCQQLNKIESTVETPKRNIHRTPPNPLLKFEKKDVNSPTQATFSASANEITPDNHDKHDQSRPEFDVFSPVMVKHSILAQNATINTLCHCTSRACRPKWKWF